MSRPYDVTPLHPLEFALLLANTPVFEPAFKHFKVSLYALETIKTDNGFTVSIFPN